MSTEDKLLEDVLVFIDRRGSLDDKVSTPNSCSIKMSYKDDVFEMKMHAYSHGMGNGSCGATIKENGKVVFEGSGSFMSRPSGSKIKTQTSGAWEKKIKEVR